MSANIKGYGVHAEGADSAGGPVCATNARGNRTSPLRTGLVSYWIMNEASGATRVDQLGANNLADHQGNIPQNNTTSILGGLGAGGALQAAGKGLQAATAANFSVGIGNSFTLSGWCNCGLTFQSTWVSTDSGLGDGNFGFGIFDPNVGAGPAEFYFNDNGVLVPINFTLPTGGAMHYITMGYDAATKLAFVSADAGARTTASLSSGIKASTARLTFLNVDNFADPNVNPSTWQDVGYWSRALSAAEVTTLYNGGAGLPFSSF